MTLQYLVFGATPGISLGCDWVSWLIVSSVVGPMIGLYYFFKWQEDKAKRKNNVESEEGI